MAIAGFVRKMSGTSEVDTESMNRHVAKMVEEALKYNKVESVLESGEEEDIFSPEYFEKLTDVKMPATKLELLIKILRRQIKEYGKINQVAAKSFQDMLEETIRQYHERRKHLSIEEAGIAQETASESIIQEATSQALIILEEYERILEEFEDIIKPGSGEVSFGFIHTLGMEVVPELIAALSALACDAVRCRRCSSDFRPPNIERG